MSPRKLRLVAKAVVKILPAKALEQLKFLNKRAAKPLAKVIKQAISNAVNNKKLKEETLCFQSIEILEGPIYKRWRAVSRGRAHSIFKRTSHIKVILGIKNQISKIQIKNKKEIK